MRTLVTFGCVIHFRPDFYPLPKKIPSLTPILCDVPPKPKLLDPVWNLGIEFHSNCHNLDTKLLS